MKFGGPVINLKNWNKTSIEKLQLEIIKNILGVHRSTSNDACRAELGLYPLKIEIQKRCVQFWHHLHQSDPDSIQYKALLANETSAESHPLNTLAHQLVHKTQLLTDYSFTPKTIIKEIDTNLKDIHDESLKIQFGLQNKLQCYSTLNRTTTFANYLLIKPFKERQILSKYRLSDHDLEIERGRHRQTWTEREQRICRHCDLQQIEDEKHFLMMCPKYLHVRETFLPRFDALIPSFTELSDSEKMPFLLGEDDNTAALAAKYVLTIHNVRCSTWVTWYWPTWSFHVFRMILILFIIYVVIYLPMLLLYILYIYWCFGNIVLRSHANKAHLNWNWIELKLNWIEREGERESERREMRERVGRADRRERDRARDR